MLACLHMSCFIPKLPYFSIDSGRLKTCRKVHMKYANIIYENLWVVLKYSYPSNRLFEYHVLSKFKGSYNIPCIIRRHGKHFIQMQAS